MRASALAAVGLAWRAAPAGLVLGACLAVLAGLIPIAVAWLTKAILDALVVPGARGLLAALAIGLAGAGLAAAIVPRLAQYIDAEMDRETVLAAQKRLYAAVNRIVGLARLEDPVFHDQLQLAVRAGNMGPRQLITGVRTIGQSAVTVTGFVVTLLAINPWMLAIVVLSAIPTLVVELEMSRLRAAAMWKIGYASRRQMFYGNLMTNPGIAKELRLFGLGTFFSGRMDGELRSINAANRALDRRELSRQGAVASLGAVIAGGGLIWTIIAAGSGKLSIGDVSVFVAAVAGVQGGLTSMIGRVGDMHNGLLLFSNFLAVVKAEPEEALPGRFHSVPALRRGVEFRDVWFRYSDEHPWVLRGVNLTIPPGQSLALVGRNGAGKSTLIKLLCRLYDPTKGSIHWDGIDLRDLPVEELRQRLGVVFQDFVEYELTARENVAVGDLTSLDDPDRISRAAQFAGIHTAITALPNGYETLLSRMYFDKDDREDPDTGVVLSGGQWQRIAIARALLRDQSDVLILDEPSAGLDAEAEHEIHTRLGAHRAGRTSLLVSHRLGAVRDADRIAVLVDGQVAELGDHDALMAAGGEYARLFRMQAAGYQMAGSG